MLNLKKLIIIFILFNLFNIIIEINFIKKNLLIIEFFKKFIYIYQNQTRFKNTIKY